MRRLEIFLSVVALTAACSSDGTTPSTHDAQVTDTGSDVSTDTASDVATDTPADVTQTDGSADVTQTDAPADVSADTTPVDASTDATPADVTADTTPEDVAADTAPADVTSDTSPVDAGADVPVVDVPVVDVPVVDVPVVDVTADVPIVDVPVVDVPTIDTAVDVPVTDVSLDGPADVAVVDSSTDVTTTDASDASTDVAADVTVTTPGPLMDLWMLRVGDGTAALSNASTAVFIERRASTDGSTRFATITLPTTMSGSNRPITLSGTATSEGSFTRSVDGHFVSFAGYAIAPGTASVASSTSTTAPRVVARVDSLGNVNTTTTLGSAYGGNNVRGAVTVDGTAFWVSGTGSPGGIEYQLLGASTDPVNVVSVPSNVRTVGIFGGRLYGSAATTSPTNYFGVFSVGASGTPTTADSTATVLPGFPTATGPSPYAFAMFDRDTAVAGIDTAYVADDRSIASGGGVQRWTYSGTTWTLGATFNVGITSGARGLTAWPDGPDMVIAAVTAENPSRVVLFRDRPGMPTTAALPIATAPTNTQFRGVVLAPVP